MVFATHFHELADTAEMMAHAACMAMDPPAGCHEEMFTYKVGQGGKVLRADCGGMGWHAALCPGARGRTAGTAYRACGVFTQDQKGLTSCDRHPITASQPGPCNTLTPHP